MDEKLQKMISPRWIKEQEGVYIPLIDKVLLKHNVPKMPYNWYMAHASRCKVQIASQKELLQMYLQKDEINKILKEHGGDLLGIPFEDCVGSSISNECDTIYVHFGHGYCGCVNKMFDCLSRAVVELKEKKNKKDRKQFNLEEYKKNPEQKVVTRDGRAVRIVCTDAKSNDFPIVALVSSPSSETEDVYTVTINGKCSKNKKSKKDLFFAP